MLPPRRQPSFLDFSDVKVMLKIYQKSDVKSSPRGVPPILAQDLEGVDAAGKEKSAGENFSKSTTAEEEDEDEERKAQKASEEAVTTESLIVVTGGLEPKTAETRRKPVVA